MRGGDHRARLALALAVVWAVGFELAPGLHVGWHALWGDHHHQTPRFDDHAHSHHHGPGADHHHRGDEPDHRAAGDREQPEHGDDSIAHRGLATLGPPPPILIPAPALAGVADPPPVALGRPPAALAISPRQRGPPV